MTPDRLRFVLCIALVAGGAFLVAALSSDVWQVVVAVLDVSAVAVLGSRGTQLSRK